ncbi:MAG TPA: DivIVA domain-containing protein [Ilumatobacter sp.]|nr:DivIVA domain-containing protein [Ilumatobacter sp.]
MTDLTPSQLSSATFRTVRKGYDPDEVDAFLAQAAAALEAAQQQATAMEARARAAVARLQEATAAQQVGGVPITAPEPPPAPAAVRVGPDEAETISRTLLLAQRTADTTIAEARAEAERIAAEARAEAETTLDSTREMSAKLLADAKDDARRLTEEEREAALNEVESLKARREFLVGDVDQLEQFLIDQRERLRSAARQIEAMCERVPSGLGSVRPPALSAADDSTPDEPLDATEELIVPPEAAGPFAGIDELVDAIEQAGAEAPVGTGDWVEPDDPGPNVDEAEAPYLPTRNHSSD